MHHVSSWRNPISISIGTLLTIGLVALPATYRRPAAPTFVSVPQEEVETRSWFGLAEGLSLPGISGSSVSWRPAGPLQFDETRDGRGHLTGYLVEVSDSAAIIEVDLHFAESVREEWGDEGPGSFAQVSGTLLGFGSLSGGMLQVETSRNVALQSTGQRGRLSMRTEWVRLPSAGHLSEFPRKSVIEFGLNFSAEAIWGAQGLSFEFGGMDEPFELVAGGHLIEQSRGSAWMSAVIEQPSHPGNRFQLELSASRDSNSPMADNHGGPGEGFWRKYDQVTGTLRGIERMSGALLRLDSDGALLEVGGAGVDGALQAALTELVVRVVSESDLSHSFDERSRALVRVELGLDSTEFAFEATGDKGSRDRRTYAMDLGDLGRDFHFRAGGIFTERHDGSARLAGELVRASDPQATYYLDMSLSEPEASDLEGKSSNHLQDWTYSENSGPVDRSSWRAYRKLEGTLVGMRGRAGQSFQLQSNGQPIQLGLGANGRSLTYGAFAAFEFKSSVDRRNGQGHLSFDLRAASEEGLELGQAQPWLEQLGMDLELVSGGHLTQAAHGGAQISAVLARKSFPNQRMLLNLQLSHREHMNRGEGTSNSATRFASMRGRLLGLEDLRGAEVEFRSGGRAASMGLGAGGDEARHGLRIPYDLRILSQPNSDQRIEASESSGVLSCNLSRTLLQRAQQARALPCVRAPKARALYLPGIAEDLHFPTGGSFEEFADGTAVLTGRLVSASDSSIEFEVRIDFDQRMNTGQVSATRRIFPANAYIEAGGPVDPGTWHSYGRARGILVGAGELAGSALEIEGDDLALEVGIGANQRNLEYGACGEFDLRLLSQPITSWGSLPETYVWGEVHLDLPRGEDSEASARAQ